MSRGLGDVYKRQVVSNRYIEKNDFRIGEREFLGHGRRNSAVLRCHSTRHLGRLECRSFHVIFTFDSRPAITEFLSFLSPPNPESSCLHADGHTYSSMDNVVLLIHAQFHPMTLIVIVGYGHIRPKDTGDTFSQPTAVTTAFFICCPSDFVGWDLYTPDKKNSRIRTLVQAVFRIGATR